MVQLAQALVDAAAQAADGDDVEGFTVLVVVVVVVVCPDVRDCLAEVG